MPEIFSRTAALLGENACQALANARVAVFGLGGVGSWCAEALVRTGVGHILLVDDDRVTLSNVNRQLPATHATLGRFKAEVLREHLLDVNPSADVTARTQRYTPEIATDFPLNGVDCVVDAIDSVACKAHLVRTATATRNTTLFSSMGAAGRLDPGHIRVSHFSKVTGDGLARALRQRFKREAAWPRRDFTCVWSDEPARPGIIDPAQRGSVMPVTASFGLRLAALVCERLARQIQSMPSSSSTNLTTILDKEIT